MKKDSITSGGFKQWKNSSSRNVANTVDVTFLVVIAVRGTAAFLELLLSLDSTPWCLSLSISVNEIMCFPVQQLLLRADSPGNMFKQSEVPRYVEEAITLDCEALVSILHTDMLNKVGNHPTRPSSARICDGFTNCNTCGRRQRYPKNKNHTKRCTQRTVR